MSDTLDKLDIAVLTLLLDDPRAGVREYARRLGSARGTIQSRLDKLSRLGVITGFEPDVSPARLGFTARAYVRLHLSQGALDTTIAALATVPEVVEACSIAGDGDVLCDVVARGPEDLEAVIQRILTLPGVMRSRTEMVLRSRIPRRLRPLLDRVAADLAQS